MQVAMTQAAKTAANGASEAWRQQPSGRKSETLSQALRHIHRQRQTNQKQSVDELDVQVCHSTKISGSQ